MESRFLEPPRETEISSKIRRWHKLLFIYNVLLFDNQESKQKYHVVHFFSFHLNGHTLGFHSTQKLEPPCTHDKQHQQESQA